MSFVTDGFRGFAFGPIWILLTYVSGVIPAAIAGAVFAGICSLYPSGKSHRFQIAMHSILGAFVGGLVGVLIGLLFFEQLSNKSWIERLASNFWVLGAPGLFGGALAGGAIGRTLTKELGT